MLVFHLQVLGRIRFRTNTLSARGKYAHAMKSGAQPGFHLLNAMQGSGIRDMLCPALPTSLTKGINFSGGGALTYAVRFSRRIRNITSCDPQRPPALPTHCRSVLTVFISSLSNIKRQSFSISSIKLVTWTHTTKPLSVYT